jgi:hypothetical protein
MKERNYKMGCLGERHVDMLHYRVRADVDKMDSSKRSSERPPYYSSPDMPEQALVHTPRAQRENTPTLEESACAITFQSEDYILIQDF